MQIIRSLMVYKQFGFEFLSQIHQIVFIKDSFLFKHHFDFDFDLVLVITISFNGFSINCIAVRVSFLFIIIFKNAYLLLCWDDAREKCTSFKFRKHLLPPQMNEVFRIFSLPIPFETFVLILPVRSSRSFSMKMLIIFLHLGTNALYNENEKKRLKTKLWLVMIWKTCWRCLQVLV